VVEEVAVEVAVEGIPIPLTAPPRSLRTPPTTPDEFSEEIVESRTFQPEVPEIEEIVISTLNLQYLKLNTIEDMLDNYLEVAARDNKTTMEVLDYLFEQERKHREAVAIERRMKSAVFPVKKTLEESDFEFQSSIDKKVIEDLATLRLSIMQKTLFCLVLLELEKLTLQLLLELKQ